MWMWQVKDDEDDNYDDGEDGDEDDRGGIVKIDVMSVWKSDQKYRMNFSTVQIQMVAKVLLRKCFWKLTQWNGLI